MLLAFLASLSISALALPLAACFFFFFLAHSLSHTRTDTRTRALTHKQQGSRMQHSDGREGGWGWAGVGGWGEGGSLALNNTGTGSDPLMEWSGWGRTEEREMWGRCDVSGHAAAAIGRGHLCHHLVHSYLSATCMVTGGGLSPQGRQVLLQKHMTEVTVVKPRLGYLRSAENNAKHSKMQFLSFSSITNIQ